MKKKLSPDLDDDLRPEYGPELFRNMKPNRFAGRDLKLKGRPPVYLDEDVSEVFQSSEAVNMVLRSAIRAMRTASPKPSPRTTTAKKRRASAGR
jgi:hypothetical protein